MLGFEYYDIFQNGPTSIKIQIDNRFQKSEFKKKMHQFLAPIANTMTNLNIFLKC